MRLEETMINNRFLALVLDEIRRNRGKNGFLVSALSAGRRKRAKISRAVYEHNVSEILARFVKHCGRDEVRNKKGLEGSGADC